MRVITGRTSARVLSEMYREKKLGDGPGPLLSPRVSSSERAQDEADRRASDKPVHREDRES
jgi:hypothetical protein